MGGRQYDLLDGGLPAARWNDTAGLAGRGGRGGEQINQGYEQDELDAAYRAGCFHGWDAKSEVATAVGLDWRTATMQEIKDRIIETAARVAELEAEIAALKARVAELEAENHSMGNRITYPLTIIT